MRTHSQITHTQTHTQADTYRHSYSQFSRFYSSSIHRILSWANAECKLHGNVTEIGSSCLNAAICCLTMCVDLNGKCALANELMSSNASNSTNVNRILFFFLFKFCHSSSKMSINVKYAMVLSIWKIGIWACCFFFLAQPTN